MMTNSNDHSGNPTATAAHDSDAVTELLSDIEGELRLHQARVQEFLDGTREYEPVTDPKERARLIRTEQVLQSALSDLAAVSSGS